jgi:hypothetical protein
MGKAKKVHVRHPHPKAVEPGKVLKFNEETETTEIVEEKMYRDPEPEENYGRRLEEGQRVKFYGTHDKSNQFTGRVVRVHEDSDLVDIAAEPDGKAIEVETTLTAHSSDITPLEE